jgi:hypothetical protein
MVTGRGDGESMVLDRIYRMRKKIAVRAAAFLLAAGMIVSNDALPIFAEGAQNANDASEKTDTGSIHAFYQNPQNPTPNQSAKAGGVEYYAQFSAKNKLSGKTEYSSKSWNTSSNIDWFSLVANNADVYDMTNSSDLVLNGQIKNTKSEATEINILFRLPELTILHADAGRMPEKPVSGDGIDQLNIQYQYNNGSYPEDELKKQRGFSWEKLQGVWIRGTLKPNEEVNLHLPVELVSQKPSTARVTVYSYSPKQSETYLGIRASKFTYQVDNQMSGVYIGAYRTDQDGQSTYKQIPAEVQALMPAVQKSDLIYSMFTSQYHEGQQADLTRKSDQVAYDHSRYLIKTERIFDAVKDTGFSTYADQTRGLWNAYAYNMIPTVKLTNDAGEPIKPGSYDANAGVQLSNYYVELHKVLDTKDITIDAGAPWDQYDNLIYAQTIARQNGKSAKIPNTEITVTHNVDHMKPGTYWVKYAYQVAPGKYVTKKAKVIVRQKQSDSGKKGSKKQGQTPKQTTEGSGGASPGQSGAGQGGELPDSPDKKPGSSLKPVKLDGQNDLKAAPKTGDQSPIAIYMALLGISGIFIGTLLNRYKRKA